MRFLMMVKLKDGADYEQGAIPPLDLVEEMTRFNEEMAQAGVMLTGEGLHPTSKAARVFTQDGERMVVDGPFAETRELFGGYWVIQVGSKEEAIEWAKKVPDHSVIIELRQIFDMEDYPEEIQRAAQSDILSEKLAN